ncbi:MAG: ABC transporter substrate-binding protein [Spirochaetales bacterium]|nr:ABC transporter substrate-binding protein [Spirochaetales bacterium]
MKKLVLVLVVLALIPIAGLFAAGQQDTEAAADSVELLMFHYKDTVAEGYEALGEAFMEENPNIDMTFEMLSTEYNTVLKSKDAAGNLPEIWCASSPGEKALKPYLDAGKIREVNDFAVMDNLSDSFKKSITFSDGNIYMVPLLTTARGLIYNTEIFKNAGYDTFPETLDGLAEACQKIEAMGIHPFASGAADGWTVGSLLYQCGHEVFASDDFGPRMDAGEASHMEIKEIFNFIDLFRDYSQPNYMSTDFMGSVSLYAQEKAAMIIQGPWAADAMMDLAPEVVAQSKMTGIPYTNDPDRNLLYIDYDAYFCISGSDAEAEAADKFFDFVVNGAGREVFSQEVKSINAYGIPFDAHEVNQSIFELTEAGKVMGDSQYINAPDGWWQNQALAMQEYLMGEVTKDEMLKKLDAEWKSLSSQ